MLLDLFKQKNKKQPATAPGSIPIPAAQRMPQSSVSQPQAVPQQVQQPVKNISPTGQQSVQNSISNQPNQTPSNNPQQVGQPITPQGQSTIQSSVFQPQAVPQQVQQSISQQPVQNAQLNMQVPNQMGQSMQMVGGHGADEIYPVILKKIKEEFKNVSGEAEKLRELDTKLDKISKKFEGFNKFMEESSTKIDEMKSKTDNFDVALYELVTNQFNPFIQKAPVVPQQVVPEVSPEQAAPIPTPVYNSPAPNQETVINESETSTLSNSDKQDIDNEFEEELKRALEEAGDEPSENNLDDNIKQITVTDNINNNEEKLMVNAPNIEHEQAFLEGAKNLTPGVNHDSSVVNNSERGSSIQNNLNSDRKVIKEQLVVEDVLNVPKEDSLSDEVTEVLSFKETWNDPEAKHLNHTPPKLKRFDLKELLGKFMTKHEHNSTTIPEYSGNEENKSKVSVKQESESKHDYKYELKQDTPQDNSVVHTSKHTNKLEHHSEPERTHKFIKQPVNYPVNKVEQPKSVFKSETHNLFEEEKKKIFEKNISNPKEYFWFSDGRVAKSIPEFLLLIGNTDNKVFNVHANEGNNDFSNWIRGVFKANIVADKILHCRTKHELIKSLS